MKGLYGKVVGVLAVTMSGLMVLTSCGAAAKPTPAPIPTSTKAPAPTSPPAATAAATTAPAPTAVPAATSTATPIPAFKPGGPVTLPKDQSPIKGGTMVLSQNGDPPTFNIYGTTLGITTNHTTATHNRLLRYKSLQWPESGTRGALEIVPDLAESYTISGSGTTITLNIPKLIARASSGSTAVSTSKSFGPTKKRIGVPVCAGSTV